MRTDIILAIFLNGSTADKQSLYFNHMKLLFAFQESKLNYMIHIVSYTSEYKIKPIENPFLMKNRDARRLIKKM